MRRLILLGFVILLISNHAFANEKGEEIKFGIITETIFFLSQDSTISTDKHLEIDCSPGDYECVQLQVGDVITGISSRLKKWSNYPADTKEQLATLRSDILMDIIEPAAKSYRKNFPTYGSYTDRLGSLIASFDSEVEMLATSYANPTNSAENDPVAEPQKPSSNTTMLTYTALALGGIALLLAIYILYGLNKKSGKKDYSVSKIEKRLELLAADFEELKIVQQRTKSFQDSLIRFKENLESHEARLVELENALPPKPHKQATSEQVLFEPKTESKSITPNTIQLRYAKFLDLDNGFFEKNLKQVQDGEQTFEIKIKGDRASYCVSNDTRAQRYALHNYEYLEKGCEFENQPEADRHIKTITNGELLKQGSNWLIQSKAIIRFD